MASRLGAMHNLFSEYADGSSSNKYLEIFNPTSDTISLDDYAFECWKRSTTPGEYEFWNAFPAGAQVAPGGFTSSPIHRPMMQFNCRQMAMAPCFTTVTMASCWSWAPKKILSSWMLWAIGTEILGRDGLLPVSQTALKMRHLSGSLQCRVATEVIGSPARAPLRTTASGLCWSKTT